MKTDSGDRRLKMGTQREAGSARQKLEKIKTSKSTFVKRRVQKPSKPGSQAPSKVARISADELKEICNKEKYTHLKRNPVHKVSPTQNNISEQEFHSLNNTNLSATVANSFLSKGRTGHTYFCPENSTENFWKEACTVRNPQIKNAIVLPCSAAGWHMSPLICWQFPASLKLHRWAQRNCQLPCTQKVSQGRETEAHGDILQGSAHSLCVSRSVLSDSLWPHGLCRLPDSSVHGILQARILEWVAILFSRWSSRPRYQTQVSCIAGRLFAIWATREALLRTNE